MSLSKFAVHAPVKVTMIFLGVLLLGYISLTRLPTSLFPDIRTPKVTTTVRTKGLSALEVERRICEPLERSLYTLRGVVDVQSIARADTAVVITEFSWDTPLDFAFLDVKKAVSDIQRDRSDEIESVNVVRYDPNAIPVMTLALKGREDTSLDDLQKLAKNTLRPRFERLEGVASVVLAGGVERELGILVDESQLINYGVDVQQVISALQADNVNAAGGYVEEGARRYLLKAVGEFTDIGEVERVVVTRTGDVPILLRDVATVSLVPREETSVVFLDGKPAVALSFFQEARGNTVNVAKSIRKEIDDLKEVLPEGVEIVVSNDQSQFITSALDEVKSNALIGGVLSIIILLVALKDFRTTVIIAVAIPISVIATFNAMYFQGLTLNLMSLGGLALGVGMLVDNAIVVLENIYRLRHEGKSNMEAAREGTRQVGAAIIASTLTTIVVFLPIVYIKGIAALLFREQALTVTYSLLASLVVALLLIPMLSARFLGTPPASMIDKAPPGSIHWNWYTRLLDQCLRYRLLVLAASVGLFAWSLSLVPRIPREFLPRTDARQLALRIVAPSGTPIRATAEIAQTVNAALEPYRPAIQRTFVRVGEDEGAINADTQDPNGPNTADFFITLDSRDHPTTATIAAGLAGFSSTKLVEAVKPSLERFEGVKSEFTLEQGSILEVLGNAGAPLVLEIRGSEIDELTRLAARYQAMLTGLPGIINVRTNILAGAPEYRIQLDRVQLGKLGFDVRTIGETLKRRIEGTVATQIKREEGDLDLRVKVDYGEETLDMLKRITLRSPNGAVVPLESVATFEKVAGPREIVRRDQERIALVYADLDGVRLSDAIGEARRTLANERQPRGYSIRFTGEEERRAEAFGKLGFALILSIALVYMVMASIFESFIQPFIILFTIPMSLVGVVLLFLVMGQSLNVMAFIGIVMLGGIVVNNAIVLLDCVNQVRAEEGLEGRASIIVGCGRRLRPVFMTTSTTLLGLLPLALGFGEGAELRQAMAVAVIGGLTSSTILTLVVIPVCQSYLDDLMGMFRRMLHIRPGGAPTTHNPQAEPTA